LAGSDSLLEQPSDYLSPLATLLAVVLAYFFGRRQTEHERLYTRRAEVIAALFERFETVDQRIFALVSPFDLAGEPDKAEKAKLAGESFNDLQKYYRGNSIWLSRGTSKLFGSFLERYKETINEFAIYVVRHDEQPQSIDKWHEVWKRFERESPEIREVLEEEFRAALGERRARISRSWRSVKRYMRRSKADPDSRQEPS
jgi:hypothetical protein